jgi:hypothetical protein
MSDHALDHIDISNYAGSLDPVTEEAVIAFLVGCGASGEGGGGCGAGLSPTFNVTLPSVGIPQISLTLPDFSGLTLEGLLKALEMIGINPCGFIDAIAGAALQFLNDLESAINNSLQGIADIPAQVVNGINDEAQAGIDGMFGGLDLSQITCEGLLGVVNDAVPEVPTP